MAKTIDPKTLSALILRGCEEAGWDPWELDHDGQLFAAEIAVNTLIESVGEDTRTGRMWQRYERAIIRERATR